MIDDQALRMEGRAEVPENCFACGSEDAGATGLCLDCAVPDVPSTVKAVIRRLQEDDSRVLTISRGQLATLAEVAVGWREDPEEGWRVQLADRLAAAAGPGGVEDLETETGARLTEKDLERAADALRHCERYHERARGTPGGDGGLHVSTGIACRE